ncbi:hemagglutinin repeat-containing protein [Xylella fastidiosa]|uniref:two-partner secretion domain-containing protein n=2 Tax=Xylella fastidiosa TaxID=2371 RepID=UPI00090CD6A7|nr:hemagglutinin repeat-containing protein [Xylella fastidiosa]ALR04935.1 hemagglutinin repeat-containing protein [Xylella fastidiosa]
MNKDLYRLIYNRALRLWQVASERATAPGGTPGPSPTAQRPARACLHPIPFALWLSLGWVSIAGIATAQVVADPQAPGAQRPTILQAAPGVPLINIQTPSQAGVSRNTYQQFDITPQGAILNNARTPAQTHLAGTVQGNPWLATGTAKIILNEVNSRTPSQLHGYLEVAGDRAQLIIANPSGITCNGCGVINASQFTLTTGTPVFNARGALDHYRVHGGAIQLDGLGLDSRSADYTALIARTVQLNAGLWAQKLQATTGPATVTPDGHPTASLPATPGDRPTVALDVSALGGMYAGKITLIGTEHGLGVRNAGQLSATSAPLTVTVDGLLENTGRLQSATDTQLTATAAVNNSGLISVAQTLSLHTPTTIDNRSGTLTAARLDITGARLDNRGGHIQQTALNRLTLQGQRLDNQHGILTLATEATIHTHTLNNAAGQLHVNGTLDLTAQHLNNASGHLLTTGPQSATLTIADLLDNTSGTLASAGSLTLTAATLDTTDGTIQSGQGPLHMDAATLTAHRGTLTSQDTLTLTGTHTDLSHATTTAQQITLHTGDLTTAGGHLTAYGTHTLQLEARTRLDNTGGTIATNGTLDLHTATLDNTGGTLHSTATGPNRLDITDTLTNTAGHLLLNGPTTLTTGTWTNTGGHLQITGPATLHATTLDNRGGILHTATGPLDLRITGTLNNQDNGLLTTTDALTLTAASLLNQHGTLDAAGPAHLTLTGLLDNTAGLLQTAHTLWLTSAGLTNRSGTLTASQLTLDTQAHTLDNTSGRLGTTTGSLTLHSGLLDNTAGLLQSAAALSIDTAAAALTNRDGGTLLAAGPLDITTTTLDNRGGTIDSQTATHLHTTTLDNTTAGHISSSGTLQIDGTTLTNTGGRLHSGGDTRLHLQDTLNNHDGRITAAGTLDIATTTLDNHSTPMTAPPVAATRDTPSDTPAAPDNGLYATQIHINSTTLDNTAGTLSAAQNLTLTLSDTLTNTAGTLSAGGTLDLTADQLSNHTGTLLSGATQTLTLHRLTGDGRLHAGNALTLTLQDSLDTAGTLSATGLLTLTTAGDLTNRGLLHAADLTAQARDITTTATGQLLATGHAHLTATGTLTNSGLLQAADLTAQARDITTTATGQLLTTGHTQLTATDTLTNRGHLQAADLTAQANTITTTGTFLATSHATLTAADTLTNSGLLQAPDLTAQANTITNTATGQLLTTGHAQLTATDTLTNSGLVHAGDLTVHARDITTTATGQLIANTLAQLTATATLTNRGLIDAFTTHLTAPTIDNLGTGRLYGDHIALHAQTLTNRDETSDGHTHAATIAARQRLDIGADTLRNTANAMILSDGDAAIGATLDNALHATGTATLLDNRSATIDITGALNITTTTLNNIRDNVHIAHAPDVVTEARMEQPHWRKNQPNGGSGNFRFTSNYDAHDIYYLNPADILKDDPYLTPDGQQIHRAIVRLTPQTSAYFYARGGLYASQAERRRMDLTGRTGDSVVLYYTDRQDKQPNPDHSAAAATNDSAFIGLDTPQQYKNGVDVPITIAPGDDRLTYDSSYGTCTDDCVRLVTWHDYTDPDHTLIDMRRGPNDVDDNEKYRDATRTTQQEILNLDAGAPALIQSGGTMMIQTDTLRNHYADLLAGGDQTIVGLPPHPTKEKSDDESDDEHKYKRVLLIDNRALQLSRTDRFHNISTTYRGKVSEPWSNESRTTPTTQIGGRITSGRHQYIAAQTFNNVTDSTHAPEPIQHPIYNPSTQTLSVVNGVITITDTSPSLHTLSLADNHRSADQELTYIPDRSITTPNAPIRDPAAPPAVTVTPTGPLTLPNNSLFTLHPDAATLITTDPRFTLGRDLTSAATQLHALGDHDTLHKRLGDGYYEQRLIREQIAQLTGRRRLDGYTDDDQQYRALLDAGITVAKQHQLRPGIALSADQLAQLTSDIVWLVEQDVHLPDGKTTRALVPRLYLRPRTGDLTPDGALLAAASTTINAHTFTNTGTIDARHLIDINTHTMDQQGGRLTADAIHIHTTGDFTTLGGQFKARDVLKVHAQGNFYASSTLRDATTQGSRHHSVTELDQQASFEVTGPGAYLGLSTDQAMTHNGVAINNTGPDGYTRLNATGPLHLGTLTTHRSDTTQWDPRNSQHSRIDTEHGTSITGNGDIRISADAGITGRAVTLDSSAGDLTLTSRHGSVTLQAGEARLSHQQERTSRRSGLLRSSSSHSTASSTDTVTLSSVLGGKNITITAGDTVHSVGTQFIADQDIDIFGTKGVRLENAETTHTSQYALQQRNSGLSRAGLGISIGSSRSSEQGDTQATSSVANTVAALNGNITIHSRQGNVDAAGSELLAAGNLNASGVNVDLGEVYDTLSTHQQQASKHSGLSIGFNSALTSTAQGVSADLNNRRNASTGRLSSLYGWRALSTAASAGYQAYGEIDTLRTTSSLPSTFQIGVSVGTSSSQSHSSMNARTARGTQLRAGGDISITAFGRYDTDEEGKPILKAGTGTINATAAQFSSTNLTLIAAGNLDAHSAQSTQEQTSSQHNRSASLGAKIGVTGGGPSISADLARGRGSSRQQSVTQVDTVFNVANHANISVGGDATLKGAHLNAHSIQARIAGNLDITSLQDTLQASAQQRQTSLGGTFVINGAGSTATFSRNRQDATQDYASVRNQSGLFAGAGGYDIKVGGHSQFNGGALTSTAPQALQAFSTHSIGHTDIHNHNSATASASGITLGSDLVSGLNKNNPNGKANIGLSIYSGLRSGAGQWMANADRSVNQHSTTAAVVSATNIQVSDPGSAAALATLRRDPIGAHQALTPTDLGALQTEVQQRSQGGALLADIGRMMADQSISNMLTPILNEVFCIQQPCTNDHTANDALVTERTQALRQAHPDWSDRKLREHAVAELALTNHNANRVLDQDKVKEMIANKGEGQYSLQNDLLASGRWGISRGSGNIQLLPVSLADLSRLSDEEKKNVTLFANGISNDIHRAAQLALQMTLTNDNRDKIKASGETYRNTTYLAYTKPTHQLGELVTAGLEKLLEITKIASPASRLQAAAAKEVMYNAEQGNYSNPVYLEGHSRGTMTESNALRVLGGLDLGDTKLEVLAYNPAAEGGRLAEAAALVTKKPVKTWKPHDDFVANKIGGYDGDATLKNLWEIFQTNYSVHSSGGTAALGSDWNHVDKDKLFSFLGLDINDMNAKRQGRTIGLLEQWQKTPRPEDPVATQLTQLQRLLWQSQQWQQQLDTTPGGLTRPTPTSPDAPSARQQQLQQLRQSLTPH